MGMDNDAAFALRTRIGFSQAEESSACDSTILSISFSVSCFLVCFFVDFIFVQHARLEMKDDLPFAPTKSSSDELITIFCILHSQHNFREDI